ncbi:MAG: hypothetical protein RO469_14490 [Thermincola sp.]|nr:hypothetical protein [Thermincola sp.]MDT3704535.1 hypothetical protein [Thermincola sp.]
MSTKKYYLCDIVDAEKCKGCTNCVKNDKPAAKRKAYSCQKGE